MAERPQVPRIAQLLGPAINAWVAVRPGVLPFINLDAGRYADIPAGWEAQLALLVRQIADEVASARLATSVGVSLTQLAASEFRTYRTPDPVASVGRVLLNRANFAAGPGVIGKGFRFTRLPAPNFNPPLAAATFTATQDVSYGAVTKVSVPILASVPGSASNAPYFDGSNTAGATAVGAPGTLVLEDTAFDPLIGVAAFEAAGGSDGEDDDDLVRQCEANATGSSGPTIGAVLAGALSGVGVHRACVLDIPQATYDAQGNPIAPVPVAYTGVALADSSWGSGLNGLRTQTTLGIWEGLVAQVIANAYSGVGGLVYVTGVANVRVFVIADILLRSADYLNDTSEISAAVLATARSYFDDRPDWWTWTTTGLQAWISRAHPKILSCPTATVYAFGNPGTPLTPPPATPLATTVGLSATHYELVQNGITPTYSAAT